MPVRRARAAPRREPAADPPPPPLLRASVIVPARDAADTIGACLDGLAREGVPGAGTELFVVDDGSRDATVRLTTRPGIQVLHSSGRGPAAARNLGATAAGGGLLVFLDADAVPRPGWLHALLAPFADPAVVAAKGRYYTSQREVAPRFAQLEFEQKYERLAGARTLDFVDTGTAAFRRDAFRVAGGFDEGFRLPSVEDVDLGFRLVAAGGRIAFAPAAAVDHHHPASLLAYLRRKARYGRFRAAVYQRHPGKALGDSYTPREVPVQILLAAAAYPVLLASLLRRSVLFPRLLAATLALFAVTTLPLTRRALASDLTLAPLTPFLSFARATAQAVGLAAGIATLASVAIRRALGGL